ncbi:uncharacterized protein [Apostichopus japonicus]
MPLSQDSLLSKLSQSFPSMSLSLALEQVKMDLNNSCFGSICIEKDDDELKPLSWLQNSDLLKDIYLDGEDDDEENCKENYADPHGYYYHDTMDPKRQMNSKPPFSFSCLIFMAIEDSLHQRLPVKDIYHWIEEHFPYYRTAPAGWKNSVRHNLSLNKCFQKVDKLRGQTLGKGSLWCVDPDYRPNLLQALRKTPFHPYHHVLPYAPHGLQGGPLSHIAYNPANRLPIIQSAYGSDVPLPAHIHLVENLLSGASNYRFSSINAAGVGTDMEVDAAATMMMFRTPPEKRVEQLVKLKREGLQPLHSYTVNNGAAPLQAKPEQPHCKATLADLAETALCDYKPKRASTPRSTAALKAKCTPSPNGAMDHTYSLSSTMCTPVVIGALEDDPVDCEMESDGSMDDSDSDSDQTESKSFNDSGVFSKGNFNKRCSDDSESERQLPLKKRLKKKPKHVEPDLVEGADALLNLAGINTQDCQDSIDNLSPVSR